MPNQYNSKGRTKQVMVKLNPDELAELAERAWRARAKSPAAYLRQLANLKATARIEAKAAKGVTRKAAKAAA